MFHRQIDLVILRRVLRWGSVVFLGLPVLLFLAGWLRTLLATISSSALIFAVLGTLRGRRDPEWPVGEGSPKVLLWKLLAGLIPVAFLVATCGAGGFGGPQTWDWVKHNAILKDIILHSWPVRYETDTGTVGLTYYIAYYLPAALMGKLGGWNFANLSLFLFTMVGAFLTFLWLVVFCSGAPILCGVLFTLFSGMDVLGAALIGEGWSDLSKIFSDYHLEWWAHYWQYSSNVSLMHFVPNQALAGWLLTALVIDAIQTKDYGFPVTVVITFSLIWSPFVTIGLLPLLVCLLIVGKPHFGAGLKAQMSHANLAGLVTIGVSVAYFASRLLPLELPQRYLCPLETAFRGEFWLMTSGGYLDVFLARYCVFIVCEFGVLWLVLLFAHRKPSPGLDLLTLLYFCGIMLLVLPIFHYGWYNDLVMRASIPALFVLQVCASQALCHSRRPWIIAATVTVLALGALYSGNLLRMHGSWFLGSQNIIATVPEGQVRNIFQIQLYDPSAKNTGFVTQYIGSARSLFFRQMAAGSEPVTVAVEDLEQAEP